MTKDEMIALMASESGISKRQASEALQAFMAGVTTQLKKGQKVSFAGFGTFTISKRKARIGRNPQTGASINIPATKVPVFRAGKHLKLAVKK
ncbi:MAG: HU family DNA-binding protein [candidate division Zixibacteria bacterium]|jgi:DNA-binding protein HU-beta|nr:HU family DNA-binding protein [candidate division Zixibacteria bacterium]